MVYARRARRDGSRASTINQGVEVGLIRPERREAWAMGIGIYNAWRLKRGVDWWAFVEDVAPKARQAAGKGIDVVFQDLYDSFGPEQKGWEVLKNRAGSEHGAKMAHATIQIEREFRAQFRRLERNPFDFECSLQFGRVGHTMVFRAFAGDGVRGAWEFLERDKRVKSFDYWNGSDRPKRIKKSEWARRRAFWDLWDGLDRPVVEVINELNFHKAIPRYKEGAAFRDGR